MGKGKRYDKEYKEMIIELYKSEMTVTYGSPKRHFFYLLY